jgi:hypothetical protein
MKTNIEMRNVSDVEIPAWLVASVSRRNAALAVERRANPGRVQRRAATQRPTAYQKDYYARLEADTAQRKAGIIPEVPEREDERDARRRRLMQAIM